MSTWDAGTARCHVFAWKEGLLSAVGHDVRLEVRSFRVTRDGDLVTATFDPRSVAAVTAVRDGRDAPGTLSAKDLATIDGYVQNDILQSKRYPEISFTSTTFEVEDGEGTITGTLALHGARRTVTGKVTTVGGRLTARLRLSQPDFGITPFKAMLGALRIQPTVDVEVSIPAPGE